MDGGGDSGEWTVVVLLVRGGWMVVVVTMVCEW